MIGSPSRWLVGSARCWAALLLTVSFGLGAQAQQRTAPGLFRDDAAAQTAARTSPLNALLYRARPLSLDLAALRTTLSAAALEQPGATPLALALPLPDGSTGRFAVYEAPVMAPALAARHPELRTYAGRGIDDATATVRLDVTPAGFHAQVLSGTAGPVYIEPVSSSDTEHYLSLRLADARPRPTGSGCAGAAYPNTSSPASTPSQRGTAATTAPQSRQLPVGSQLRTLRVAVATTDEYTALYGGPALALGSVVRTINRVTGVYERELAVRLELVPNEDLLIAANSSSSPDPFSNNNFGDLATSENQTFIDRVIGSSYYDLGHVFGTYSASYAYIGVVCDGWKARGESGFPTPNSGDLFDIRTVAHEMGHQLGASHSFNSSNAGSCNAGNWMGSSAYEPGSGTTIMSYAGLCTTDNLASQPDAYFHTDSYQTIQLSLAVHSCGVMVATGNTPPVAIGPAGGKVLPVSTPFKLTASATDANNDALTYCWEQMDRGTSDSPSSAQLAGQTPPLFRSWPGSSSPTRYFPALPTLLANANDRAERLPTVARPLTFVCTVRDAHNGPLGVVGGVAQTTDLALTVTAAAGPFLVTAPNAAVSWVSGSSQTVTWNVAGTDANGVNCAAVNIRLSTDGGYTYPITLLANTPNDGSQAITVPNLASTTARLLVEAADNYFFDISNANFTITASPTAPVLSSLSAGNGVVGSTITVTGSNLTGLSAVTVGGVSATFAGATATGFSFVVPAGATGGPVLATTPNGLSNGLAFVVRPGISSFAPASGPVGSLVTISGTNLSGITALSFNGTAASSFSSNADGTQVTATVPAGATTGLISLTTPAGSASSATSFTVLPTPCTPPGGILFQQIGSTSATVLFAGSASAQSYTVSTTPASTSRTVSTGYVVMSGLTGNTAYTLNIVSNCPNGQTSAAATAAFTTAPAVLNNECATALVLTPGAPGADCSPVGGTVAGATQSLAPNTCNGAQTSAARDVWYQFTATSDTHVLSARSAFPAVLELFSGTCASLSSRACASIYQAVGDVTTLNMTGLTIGSTYRVRYYPFYANPSQPEFILCLTTLPPGCQAPTNVVVTSPTTSTARLNFTGSPTAINYTISTVPYSTPYTTSSTSTNLINLSASTTYTVNVVSNCSGGVTSSAGSTTFTTETPPPCTPPTDLRMTSISYNQATVGFTANPTYSYFMVSTVPYSALLYTTDNPITLPNLQPSTTYTASLVMQCGAAGTGTPVSITFTTLPPPCTPATNLAVSSITPTSAVLNFTPSATATSYTVTTVPATTTQTVTAGPVTFSGLLPGQVYTVNVSSNCPVWQASASTTFTTTPPDLVVSTTTAIAAQTYRNLTITGTGNGTPSGPLTITGVLRVQSGGQLNSTCDGISGPGSFVLEAGATLTICHAQGIDATGATGALQLMGGCSFSSGASYEYSGRLQDTGPGLPGQVFSLTANTVNGLTLTRNLSISRLLRLSSSWMRLGNNNLTLLSNAQGTAYVVTTNGGQVVRNGTGRAFMQRYMQPSTSYTGPGYRHFSSPMAQISVSALSVPGMFTPRVNAAYNALPRPNLPLAQFPTVFGYNQDRLTATYSDFETGWYSPALLTDTLRPARGYTVNLHPADTVSLNGTLRTGVFNMGTIRTGPLLRGPGPDAGWHLLGNPYPAPIDWRTVENTPGAIPSGLTGSIYVFEPETQYTGLYRSYTNNIGTLGFDGVLPAMQGFFVRATQNVPGGFTFTDAFRATTYLNPTFHRASSPRADAAGRPLLRLQLSSPANPAASPDETVVYLEAGASASGTDARFDAPKAPNPGAVVSLASQMPGAGNEPLAINGLPPLGAGSASVRVPLHLALPTAGSYQLRAAALTDFNPALPVLLLDLSTGQTIDLRQQPDYAFTATQAGALNGRFELWLGRPGGALATAAAASTSFSLWPNPVRSKASLHLALDSPATTATATLCDVLGRPVAQHHFGGSITELPTHGLAPGTYLLRVQVAGQAASTRRVVVE